MVFLNRAGEIEHAAVLPRVGDGFDLGGIATLVKVYMPSMAVVERVTAMPGQGVSGMFSFGAGYGMLQGILAALEVPYALVTPQTWRKQVGLIVPDKEPALVHVGLDAKAVAKALGKAKAARTNAVKAATVQQALARWPALTEPLRVKARWGIADAAFLAECARRMKGVVEGAA